MTPPLPAQPADAAPSSAPAAAERTFAVVLNPRAGRGLALREWPRLEAELRARGLRYTLIQEQTGEAALARVQALAPDVAVLAVGGDGTVAALLPALVGTGRPLAVVPLGTGNDFAGMLRLRPGHFADSLSRLSFQPRALDAMEVRVLEGEGAGTTRLLLNGLGMGFDAEVTANLTRVPARVHGLARYAWSALATLRELHLAEVEVVADGERLVSGPSALVAVMNGTRYGGGFLISPDSDPRDARLNALASGPVSRPELLGLMARVLRGAHLDHPKVHHRPAERVTVRWSAPTYLHLDGDLAGKVVALEVRVLPGALQFLTA